LNTGIYSIHSPSGRFYIGSAVDVVRRWRRHRAELRSGTHGNRSLQRAANKYGTDNLTFTKMLICRKEDLLFYEQLLLDGLKPLYNIAPLAGSSFGIKRSDEFRRKISIALTGRVVSQETRRRIGAKHRGKKISPEHVEAVRGNLPVLSLEERREMAKAMHTPEAQAKAQLARVGRKVSEATKAKIRASLMGHAVSAETREKLSLKNRRRPTLQDGS
jgi:group I intron endonuclease